MKLNKILIALIILAIIGSVSVAVAEDASVGGYTFTVPEGYTIINQTDNLVIMQADENNVVNFATEVSDDIETAKESQVANGNELISEDTITYNDIEINVQAFSIANSNLVSYNYIVLSEDGNYAVTVVTDNTDFDGSLETEGNPATTIFDSIAQG